jgi:hypothetical protein
VQVLATFVDSLDKGSDQKMVSRHREWEKLIQAERLALAKSAGGNRGGQAECSGSVRTLLPETSPWGRLYVGIFSATVLVIPLVEGVSLLQAHDLIRETSKHPRFKELYSLPSYDKCWYRVPR